MQLIKKTGLFLWSIRLWQWICLGVLMRVAVCLWQWTRRGELASLTPETLPLRGVDGNIVLAYNLWNYGSYTFQANGSPVPFRPPLTSLLMVPFGAIVPQYWYLLWTVAVALLGGTLIWLVYDALCEAGVSDAAARIAAAIIAVHPYLAYVCWLPNSYGVGITVFTLVFWAFVKSWKRGGKWNLVLGAALGLACLTHGSGQLLAPVYLFFLLLSRGKLWKRIRDVGLAALVCFILVLPWTIRNEKAFGLLIPVATGSGLQYWLAEKNYFGGFTTLEQAMIDIEKHFEPVLGQDIRIENWGILDPKQDNKLLQLAMADLRENPKKIFTRTGIGMVWFWALNPRGTGQSLVKAILLLPWAAAAAWIFTMTFRRQKWEISRLALAAYASTFVLMGVFALIQATEVYVLYTLPTLICGMAILWEKQGRSFFGKGI